MLPPTEFSQILDDSFTAWKEQNYKAAWIKLKKTHSEYIPILLDNGFDFHNAWYDRVTLCKWFLERESHLPNPATHYIGIGGLCINEKEEVLMI